MKKIVVLDDDNDIRTVLRMTLEKAGYEVEDFHDGDALISFLQNQPAVILMTDIFMPGKDGIEVIIECRKQFKDLKIIAMTGGGDIVPGDLLTPAKFLGADFTIEKPLEYEDVVNAVKSLIGE